MSIMGGVMIAWVYEMIFRFALKKRDEDYSFTNEKDRRNSLKSIMERVQWL